MKKLIQNKTTLLLASVLVCILLIIAWFINRELNHVDLPEDIAAAYDELPDKLDYNLHVKPILSDNCFFCHGPDKTKQKAGLALHLPERAFEELTESPGKYAITAGDVYNSEVFHRILSDDEAYMMPTPESNLSLTAKDKAVLIKWIQQGAKYKEHWAYIKPEKAKKPKIKNKKWAQNEIDYFIANKLDREKLSPSEKAPKEKLIRRAYQDLIGLPPTVAQVNAFVEDNSENAFEKVIDELLSSKHYGEKMAMDWLDVARYADSHGYQDDLMRVMWPWRDWVINSFNSNQPFDEFIEWQIAGDMMPNPSKEMVLATGFNRNHMINGEGGVNLDEFRTEYVADRTNTLGKAFLGHTLECARCHDHKYDQISQKEYYQVFAFFNNIDEYGQAPNQGTASPSIMLPTAMETQQIQEIKNMISGLEIPQKKEAFRNWTNSFKATSFLPKKLVAHYDFEETRRDYSDRKMFWLKIKNKAGREHGAEIKELIETINNEHIIKGKKGKGLLVDDQDQFAMNIPKPVGIYDREQPFSISLWINPVDDSASGPVYSRVNQSYGGFRGYYSSLNKDKTFTANFIHSYPSNTIEIKTKKQLPVNKWSHLTISYDGSSTADGVSIYLNGEKAKTETIHDNLLQSMLEYSTKEFNKNIKLDYQLNLKVGQNDHFYGRYIAVDDFMVFENKITPLGAKVVYENSPKAVQDLLASTNRSKEEDQLLYDYYQNNFDSDYANYQDSIQQLRAKKGQLETEVVEVMVMKELPEPRISYILDRGVFDAKGEEVGPNIISAIMPFPDSLPRNRLGLAYWLTAPENPIVSRVIVNRFWQMLFGKGLVTTPDDFGNQGKLPTHPELLDWLAVDYIESGWDTKALLKKIMLSATYQQESRATKEMIELDPKNLLYARGPSHRLSAELVRDNALATSGLLVPQVGGKSVYPYQPAGLWQQLSSPAINNIYEQGSGEDLYRRSLYTVWRRTTPPPSLVSFDAPGKNVCTVNRQKTNTPLQALVLLNDPQFVEAARVMAEKIVKKNKGVDESIKYAFQKVTSRMPDENEFSFLTDLYYQEKENYTDNKEEALDLIQVGESAVDDTLDPVEVASMMMVTHTLLNHDNAVYKR